MDIGSMSKQTSSPTLILPCRIIKVYKENMTVDVSVKETSANVYSVPISFPSKGKGYGSYFMPREGSTYLLIYSNANKPYLLAYAPYSVSKDEINTSNEKLLAGENLIQSIGDAYSKQDFVGNNLNFARFSNSLIQDVEGVNRSYALGHQELDIASKHISGFSFNPSGSTTKTMLTSTEQKVLDYSEIYSKIVSPKIYKPAEISIDSSLESTIISEAQSLIALIETFKTSFMSIKAQMQDMTISDATLETLITQAYTELKNFNIEKKGVKIITERGNAVNKLKRPADISNVGGLLSTDYDQLDGVDICYRMAIEDELGVNLVLVEIDVLGNCNVKLKSLTIEGDLSFIDTTPGTVIDGGTWD